MFGRNKHLHQLRETRRVYMSGPGITSMKDVRSAFQWQQIDRLVWGVTFVELACETCGDIVTREFTGNLLREG